jgi:hypothetical protein
MKTEQIKSDIIYGINAIKFDKNLPFEVRSELKHNFKIHTGVYEYETAKWVYSIFYDHQEFKRFCFFIPNNLCLFNSSETKDIISFLEEKGVSEERYTIHKNCEGVELNGSVTSWTETPDDPYRGDADPY